MFKTQPTDKIGALSFYNADNLEIMRGFKDNEFDLAIVDPPYGIDIAEKLANGWVSKAGGTKFEAKSIERFKNYKQQKTIFDAIKD